MAGLDPVILPQFPMQLEFTGMHLHTQLRKSFVAVFSSLVVILKTSLENYTFVILFKKRMRNGTSRHMVTVTVSTRRQCFPVIN